ncbi:hypothetical protein [Staphylococcus agnetis]|uniref:hypothetical protein n=1 Tax=Staphylococcus agnetis TaxID=985762 RepID=UPI001430CEB5|nr:hypothetical protein [Staphylococcus agnetis]NJH98096.1 hypothetical protein [Staphylococcus agnetis]NJH98618.1 hypothetical protein [Staphylococcus agnetis]
MKNYYHLLSFHDDMAEKSVNSFLKDGWELVHVGTKLTHILDNGQAYYNTEYVLGGTKEQYKKYISDSEKADKDLFSQFQLSDDD